jgi:hypothetical protein
LADRPWFGRASLPDAAALSRLEITNVRAAPRENDTREIDDVPVPDLTDDEVEDDVQ